MHKTMHRFLVYNLLVLLYILKSVHSVHSVQGLFLIFENFF